MIIDLPYLYLEVSCFNHWRKNMETMIWGPQDFESQSCNMLRICQLTLYQILLSSVIAVFLQGSSHAAALHVALPMPQHCAPSPGDARTWRSFCKEYFHSLWDLEETCSQSEQLTKYSANILKMPTQAYAHQLMPTPALHCDILIRNIIL